MGPDARHSQRYPVLGASELAVVNRFASGEIRTFEPGSSLYEVGDRDTPVWVLVDGEMYAAKHDGLGHEAVIVTLGPNQFTGELNQLGGYGALTAGRAGPEGCAAFPLDAAHVRALLIGSAEVGEIFMRALILRRVALIEGEAAGAVLIGRPHEAHLAALQGFLTRNGYPNTALDPDEDVEAAALMQRLGVPEADLPLMVCPGGEVLRRPSELEVALCLGITPPIDGQRLYDVVIVGAGPAGLAAAVYAASEGLSVAVLDQRAIGGQAGASARIENYLGFPTGVSGQALAGRAFSQALKFGAEMIIPAQVAGLECAEHPGEVHRLKLASGETMQARTIVIASGARYRRPAIENLEAFEGAGVSYWASAIEARLCDGGEVGLIGGGNSAGQAVVFLAARVGRVHLMVRGAGLQASMSRYLIDRIEALENVEVHVQTEVLGLHGRPGDAEFEASIRRRGEAEERKRLRHLFVFVGADPNTGWLDGCVALDRASFIRTGVDADDPGLQTSRFGVFAIGDVRGSSTKRVAAAVGEGAAVVAQIHRHLATLQ